MHIQVKLWFVIGNEINTCRAVGGPMIILYKFVSWQ